MLDSKPTLSELADYAQQWAAARGLELAAAASYCDQVVEDQQ